MFLVRSEFSYSSFHNYFDMLALVVVVPMQLYVYVLYIIIEGMELNHSALLMVTSVL